MLLVWERFDDEVQTTGLPDVAAPRSIILVSVRVGVDAMTVTQVLLPGP